MRKIALISCGCILSWFTFGDSVGMELTDNQDVTRHNARMILKKVEEGEPRIEGLVGKDVVIVLGRTQVGKSTTINFLLGANLSYSDEFNSIILDKSKSLIGFAQIGGEGISCTVVPAVYSAPGTNYVFLDTRGFYDVMMDPESDIAASILTEMAVKKANSVRVMVLEDFGNLEKGVVTFRELGKTLGKIVVGQRVPILFLFNRYTPPKGSKSKTFNSKDFDGKQEIIMDSIRAATNRLLAGEEKIISNLVANLSTIRGIGSLIMAPLIIPYKLYFKEEEGNKEENKIDDKISSSNEFQKAISEVSYTTFLKYNVLEQGNISHVEPLDEELKTNEESKAFVLKALERLEPVAPHSLVFNGYSTARVEFDDAFVEKVGPLLLLIKAKSYTSKYSLNLLDELQKEAENCLKYHREVLKDIQDSFNDDKLAEIESAYSTCVQDRDDRINQLKKRKIYLEKLVSEKEKKYSEILAGENVLYWTDRWHKECGFFAGWWRNYTCTYPRGINFVDWKESLGSGTTRSSINKSNSPYLELSYTSEFAFDCRGEVKVYVAPKDDPSTASLLKVMTTEINGFKGDIEEVDSSIRNVEKNIAQNIQSKIKSNIRIFKQKINYLKTAVDLRKKVDHLYKDKEDQIKLCTSIADKLESCKPVVSELREFYHQHILEKERDELDPRFMDQIFQVYLLDPVQLNCSGSHGRAYERYKISEHLKKYGNCPDCKERTSRFIPIGNLAVELSDIIDNIHSNTNSAINIIKYLGNN